ncbi:MAG: ATP-dependent DNA ligase [Candidatus Omnitrophota bacterium]
MKFKNLVIYFERLESTTKRLEMIDILAALFKSLNSQDKKNIEKIIYFIQGQLLPSFKSVEFGISEKIIHRAIIEATGCRDQKIKEIFKKYGDYGQVAEEVCVEQTNSPDFFEVYENLEELAVFAGDGAVGKKVDFLARLLNAVSATEAKYVVRIILGKLRLGVGDPTLLDSLCLAYFDDKFFRTDLERTYNLCSDLGLVAKTLFNQGKQAILDFKVIVGNPVRVALAARLSSPEEIIEKIGECAVEAKYDGFRCQVHKKGEKVEIFSRNLENMTHMFPEIKAGTLSQIKEKNVIFEGEALAYDPKSGVCLPFQVTVQRKRKYDIAKMQKQFPLRLFVFDILYDGTDLTQQTYLQRRKIMDRIIRKGKVLEISPMEIVKTADRLIDVFETALDCGREGIVAKRLDGEYRAGGRNFNWIKLKQSYSKKLNDTVDCVIVGYFSGRGLRAAFGVGSLLACVYDKTDNHFKTIAKIGSGLSELELKKLKNLLDKIKMDHKPELVNSVIEPDVWVEPKYVMEVQADEITKSPVHTCGKGKGDLTGFALRFPRTVGFIRTDKNAEDATCVDEIINMFAIQGGKK